MVEKSTHKQTKSKMAGKTGKKEVPLKSGKRLDVMTKHKAVEVERGTGKRLVTAAKRLKESRKSQKVLVVPQKSMSSAKKAMKIVGVSGTVRNISGTKRSYVPPKSKSNKKPR